MEQSAVLQVGVKILLQDKEGKFLLLHRSLEKYPEAAGRWDIPGGRIEPGATLVENLRREIREETNLEIAGEPELIAAQDILRITGRHIVRLTYRGQANGDVILDETENDSYRWFSRDEIEALDDLDFYLKGLVKAGGLFKE